MPFIFLKSYSSCCIDIEEYNRLGEALCKAVVIGWGKLTVGLTGVEEKKLMRSNNSTSDSNSNNNTL